MEAIMRMSSWHAIAMTALVYAVTLVVYRLFLHPLARFPGPKLAAITRYYEAYYDVLQGGQYEFRIAEMHRKFGPIVRISPYELHIKDAFFSEKLFRHEGRWNKYDWNTRGHNAPGAVIFTSEHDLHKARRQPLNSFFSKARVSNHQSMILKHLDKLCSRIAEVEGSGRTLDLGAAMSAFQRDVSTEFLLGRNYDTLAQEDFGIGMTLFMQAGGKIWRTTKHIPWYGPLMLAIPREFLIKHSGDEGLINWLRYESEKVTERLLKAAAHPSPTDNDPRTIVHEIVQSDLPAVEKSFARVFSDVVTITGAGFETTASVMRMILYNVWSNPQILKRLRSELTDAHLTSPPELNALEKLPYLTAVLLEAMRLSPALGSRLQRVAPDRDIVYKNWRIPAGTPVGITTLDMHMDEGLYPEPSRFNPERWTDPESRKRAEKVYAPFSRGSRVCLGMHLAWAELYLIIAVLVQRFDFDFSDIAKDHFEIESDLFIIGIKGKAVLEGTVKARGVSDY